VRARTYGRIGTVGRCRMGIVIEQLST